MKEQPTILSPNSNDSGRDDREGYSPQAVEHVRVCVLFFGAAREMVGCDQQTFEVPVPATVATVYQEIQAKHPHLSRFGRSLLFAVNQEYADMDSEVREADELAIFPPVSGGTDEAYDKDFFEVTTEPINVGEVARRVVLPQCGASVSLDGYARAVTRGHEQRTQYLVYEAYAPMALKEMRRLGNEAHARFEIAHIGIVHRTGRLEIGETSVVISISAPHRGSAFAACEWAIRELKRTVPIWKKEVFGNGEEWVEGSFPAELSAG